MDLTEKTIEYVKGEMKNDSGHDWYHVERVWKMAKRIAEEEDADMFVVEMAALLHDIADWKFHGEGAGSNKAMDWLKKNGVEEEKIKQIIRIIDGTSFRGEGETPQELSLEGRIVQDADRLDAIGAIGVARTFVFAGWKGNAIYDPKIPVVKNMKYDQYMKVTSPSVNHFYEKLLLLKGMMNTKTGKKLAEGRHKFMEEYLDQFFKEWKGER